MASGIHAGVAVTEYSAMDGGMIRTVHKGIVHAKTRATASEDTQTEA